MEYDAPNGEMPRHDPPSASQRRDTREGDATAHTRRVEREALALVLAAELKAYPAGADVILDE